jgi:diguanylate cyclase (GGDEF)-like protein
MRRGRIFIRYSSDASPACVHFGNEIPDESLCLPLMGQNEIIGMLCLQISKSEEKYFTQDVQNLAIACADSIALAIANLRLRDRLRNQTIRDPLTGIFNRRFMEETLEREIHRAGRNQEPLCVIMFEIDDFKQYNNTFGHDAGDYVLKKVTDTMRSRLRRSDFPCRYGGDEFTLLLPNTTLEDGAQRAEELRKAVEALALSFNNQALGQVTVRMGVAIYPKHGETGESVLKVADDASYRARAIGKNCVVVAE